MNILLNFVIIFVLLYFAFKFHVLAGIAVLVILGIIGYISNYPRLMAGRANAEFLKKNYDLAFKYYKKAYKSNHRKYNVDISYAQALLRVGKPEESLEVLNKIMVLPLKKEMRRPATMVRCMVKYRLGMLDEAYEEAVEIFEDGYVNSNMYSIIGLFMHEKGESADKVLEFCEKAYDFNADNRDIVDNLLLCYIKTKNAQKAISLGSELTEKYPQFIEGWFHLAQAYLLGENYEEAKRAFEKIKDCERSYLTTVSQAEIDDLYTKLNKEC